MLLAIIWGYHDHIMTMKPFKSWDIKNPPQGLKGQKYEAIFPKFGNRLLKALIFNTPHMYYIYI
jgi:hypothetical protein